MKEKMKEKMKKLTKKLTKKKIIILIGIIVVITLIGLKVKGQKVDEFAFSIQEAQITKGYIEETMSKTSAIESAVFQKVKLNKSGTVEEVYVTNGDNVIKGETLLRINYDEIDGSISESNYNISQLRKEIQILEENKEKYTIKAPTSGILKALNKKKGDNVNIGDQLARITDTSTMVANLQFTKDKIGNIHVGDEVEITLPQYFSKVTGIVTKKSDIGYGLETGGIAYDVEVEFPNEGALLEGVLATGSIMKNGIDLKSMKAVNIKWKADEIIYAEVSGEIISINYEINQQVNKDAVIAKISDENYIDKLNMEKNRLANMESNYTRDKKRFDDHVYAPVNGSIVDLNIVSGENVAGDTVIATIADLENYQITIPVDESYILKVKENQKAIIKVNAIEGIDFTGTIKKVYQIGKSEGGNTTYDVVISFDNNQDLKNLRIGMNAKVKVVLNSKDDVLLVPLDYVDVVGDDYIVKVKGEDGIINEIKVNLGLTSSDFVEIEGDIKEGDVVINDQFSY